MADDERGEAEPGDGADVIQLPGAHLRAHNDIEAALDDLPLRTVPQDYSSLPCKHRHATVDPEARTLTCRDCNSSLDPIAFIADLAGRHESPARTGQWLRRDVRRHSERVRELERIERNVKARIRNAKKKLGVPRRDDGFPLCPICLDDSLEDRHNPIPDANGTLWCSQCRRVTIRNGREAT